MASLFADYVYCQNQTQTRNQDRAKTLFEEGRKFFARGEYGQAIIRFHQSYELSNQKELLYNIAVCYEKMGQNKQAVEFYQKYLQFEEDETEKQKIRRKIEKLKAMEEGKEAKGRKKTEEATEEKTFEQKGVQGRFKHCLRLLFSTNLSNEPVLHFNSPAWMVRAGYTFKLTSKRVAVGGDFGYGWLHEDYFKDRAMDIVSLQATGAWEALGLREKVIELFIGGTVEFRYFFKAIDIKNFWIASLGPDIMLQWNFRPKVGFVIDLLALAGYKSSGIGWAVGFCIRVGIIWTVKQLL